MSQLPLRQTEPRTEPFYSFSEDYHTLRPYDQLAKNRDMMPNRGTGLSPVPKIVEQLPFPLQELRNLGKAPENVANQPTWHRYKLMR